MDCKQETPFRIGGVYRQQDGKVVRLASYAGRAGQVIACIFRDGRFSDTIGGDGARFLADGRYIFHDGPADDSYTLIPGELTQTPSGWVALGAEPKTPEQAFDDALARVRKVLFDQGNAAMIARDGPARIAVPKPRQLTVRVVSTAKPNPFPNAMRSPDCDSGPSDHLNASRHQIAGMKG